MLGGCFRSANFQSKPGPEEAVGDTGQPAGGLCVWGPPLSTALASPQSSAPSRCAHNHADVRTARVLCPSLPSGTMSLDTRADGLVLERQVALSYATGYASFQGPGAFQAKGLSVPSQESPRQEGQATRPSVRVTGGK